MMMTLATARTLTGNRLLDRLPDEDFDQLRPHLRPVPLPYGRVIHEEWQPVAWSYFPTGGVVSATSSSADGRTIEIANVGREGITGVAAALGLQPSLHRLFVQVPGVGLRVELIELRRLAESCDALGRVLQRYFTAYLSQISQSVACNGLHNVRQRCCRWLLTTHDRLDGDELPLTHENLGMILGVRRASVTEALGALQEEGLITGERGKILVLDRHRLQAACCECYRKVNDHYARLLG